MIHLLTFAAWFSRGALAWLLVLFTLFMAMAIVGIGNATTDASAVQLYLVGGVYAIVSWSALAYTLLGTREFLRWTSLLVPLVPVFFILAVETFDKATNA